MLTLIQVLDFDIGADICWDFSEFALVSVLLQCDFQVVYASGIKGKAGLSPDNLADDLGPLFESVIRCIPGPRIEKDGALQMLVSGCSLKSISGIFYVGDHH